MYNPNDSKYNFPLNFNEVVGGLEESLIRAAMKHSGNNMNQAAKLLKLKRTTMVAKVKKIMGNVQKSKISISH